MFYVIARPNTNSTKVNKAKSATCTVNGSELSFETLFECDLLRKITCVEAMFASALIAELCH